MSRIASRMGPSCRNFLSQTKIWTLKQPRWFTVDSFSPPTSNSDICTKWNPYFLCTELDVKPTRSDSSACFVSVNQYPKFEVSQEAQRGDNRLWGRWMVLLISPEGARWSSQLSRFCPSAKLKAAPWSHVLTQHFSSTTASRSSSTSVLQHRVQGEMNWMKFN